MLQLPVTTRLRDEAQEHSPQSALDSEAGHFNEQHIVETVGQYETYDPFEPLEEEPHSRASTAQSSRSQTPDNTDVDDNAGLTDEFEKVSLSARALPWEETRSLHINDLPIDIMHEILQFLRDPRDLLTFMRVQRRWFGLAAPRVWSRPLTGKRDSLEMFCSTMRTPQAMQALPYAHYVSRLNFSAVNRDVTDDHVVAMALCTNLRRLTLARCRNVSPAAVARVVQNTPNLGTLELDEVPIDDAFLAFAVRSCPDLQILYADSGAISDKGLAELMRLGPSLRHLRLKGSNRVTPHGVLKLALACRNLTELDVADLGCFTNDHPPLFDQSRGFTSTDVQSILLRCPSLRTIRISDSPRLTDSALNLRNLKCLPKLSNLRELQISLCPLITDAGVLQITKAAPRLRQLNLSRCFQITDRSLEYVASTYGSTLESLHVAHCMNITDRGVIALSQHCHRLWYFDAANCTNLTDHSIVRLTRLRYLRRIGVVKCTGITDRSILAISEALPKVERLHLSYCVGITQYSIMRLLRKCQNVVHLSLSGVPAFMMEEIRRMCRSAPDDLSEHQRQVFCVFSNEKVSDLRNYLLELYSPPRGAFEQSQEASTISIAEIPAERDAPEDIASIVMLRDQNLRDQGARERVVADALESEQSAEELGVAQEHHVLDTDTLRPREGLVRFGPRQLNDAERQARQFYLQLVAHSERMSRLSRSVDEHRDATSTEETEETDWDADSAAAQQTSDLGRSGPDVDLGSEAVRSQAASVAEIRAQRFRLIFRPQSAPTGPLEGSGLPPR